MLRFLRAAHLAIPILLPLLASAAPVADDSVKVVAREIDGAVHLIASLRDGMDVTMTVEVTQTNLKLSRPCPFTVDLSNQSSAELLVLRPVDPRARWNYEYKYFWRYGGSRGAPQPGAVYVLPYPADKHYQLHQGNFGMFSHQRGSQNDHAFDFNLPAGSTVCAAREGVVAAVRVDSNIGGATPEFKESGNYVVIRHADGTYAEYLHLQHNGALVKVGDRVQARQPVARSGNTGFSTRPHLHFCVFRTIDGHTRETLPVLFRLGENRFVSPSEGRTY